MEKGFFQVVSVKKFLELLHGFQPLEKSQLRHLEQCSEFVLAQDIQASDDLPPFARSSMDGYAVRAADTFGASEMNPAYLKVAGKVQIDSLPDWTLNPGYCAEIVTGAGLPHGADSVVMVEYTEKLAIDEIEVRRSVAPGDNLLLQGEDGKAGQTQIKAGIRIRPQHIGIMAAHGYQRIKVRPPLQVGIISTGDELVPVSSRPAPGQIRDVNTSTLLAWIKQTGSLGQSYGIIPDDLSLLQNALQKAVAENDLVLISGGSSVGTMDLTLSAVQGLPEGKILAHGVSLSPGKPTILAQAANKPILGLPGQVTSVQIVMFVLGLPFLRYLGGESRPFDFSRHPRVTAKLSRNIASKQGREDYIRVSLQSTDTGEQLAQPILGKSGLLKTMLQADGLVRIPEHSEGLLQDSQVTIWLLGG